MTTITIDRATVEQALEALESLFNWKVDPERGKRCGDAVVALRAALAQQAEPVLQTCNCRWDGEVQVQQCTLHEAHVDAIHEWAERAKVAERKLAQQVEPGEPAFHGFMSADGTRVDVCFTPSAPRSDGAYATAYYTTPPQRKPLTEEEILRVKGQFRGTMNAQFVEFARAIEKAHGIGGQP